MTKKMVSCDFDIECETEKAVSVCINNTHFNHQSKFVWIPKSLCEIEEWEVIDRYDALNRPIYGKRRKVKAVAAWFYYQKLK